MLRKLINFQINTLNSYNFHFLIWHLQLAFTHWLVLRTKNNFFRGTLLWLWVKIPFKLKHAKLGGKVMSNANFMVYALGHLVPYRTVDLLKADYFIPRKWEWPITCTFSDQVLSSIKSMSNVICGAPVGQAEGFYLGEWGWGPVWSQKQHWITFAKYQTPEYPGMHWRKKRKKAFFFLFHLFCSLQL